LVENVPLEDKCAIDWAIDDIQKAIENLNKTHVCMCFPETKGLNDIRNRLIDVRRTIS